MTMPYAAGLALVVTDRSQVAGGRTLLDVVAAALEGGAGGVMVRERDLPDAERGALVAAVSSLTAAHGALLVVAAPFRSGRPVAECTPRTGAHAPFRSARPVPEWMPRSGIGVHLRRDEAVPAGIDRATSLVGRSCHDLAELHRAADDGLDYVTLSPVAATASKPGYGPPLGVAGVRDLIAAVRAERQTTPAVLALGGVDADNAGSWLEAGADGVAVMGEVMRATDPGSTMRAIVRSVAAAQALTR